MKSDLPSAEYAIPWFVVYPLVTMDLTARNLLEEFRSNANTTHFMEELYGVSASIHFIIDVDMYQLVFKSETDMILFKLLVGSITT